MAKQQQQRERERGGKVKVGKGKVTAVQVAFMVERYLTENKYSNTLAAFRLDAADLFAKMNKSSAASNKTAMKGLMGLGEILDEYINLKEQKLLLQRDRTRLDSAMHAFHNLFRSYFNDPNTSPLPLTASPNSSSPSPSHLNPHFSLSPSPSPIPPLFSAAPATISTPSTSNSIPTTAVTTTCTPITTTAYPKTNKKRKASTSTYTLPASKMTKPHSICAVVPSSSPLVPSTSKLVPVSSNIQNKVQLVNQSIAKSLFKPGQPISLASPETPQPNPSSHNPNPTTCSIVSSERSIIVSPLKGGGGAAYYSVERTCQFTSPLKTDARTSGKIRDHVKGKLNFDSAYVNAGLTEVAIAPNDDKVSSSPSTSSPSSSSDGGDNQNQVLDGFDFDFCDFDILNGDFSFSELLVDLDLDNDGSQSHSQSSPEQTNTSPR